MIEKIDNPEYESKVPEVSEYEVFERKSKTNKPKSGVPGDLPKTLVSEFAPELSAPVAKIFQKILKSAEKGTAKWPASWKQEFGTPFQKIANPQTQNNLVD